MPKDTATTFASGLPGGDNKPRESKHQPHDMDDQSNDHNLESNQLQLATATTEAPHNEGSKKLTSSDVTQNVLPKPHSAGSPNQITPTANPRRALTIRGPRKPRLHLNPPRIALPDAGLETNTLPTSSSRAPYWTHAEDQALILVVRGLVAEGKTHTEQGWEEASTAMRYRGFQKTNLACRNRWGRKLREQTGLDERKPRAGARNISTGHHLPGARKKHYQKKKAAKAKEAEEKAKGAEEKTAGEEAAEENALEGDI